jgi:hypothetical protein
MNMRPRVAGAYLLRHARQSSSSEVLRRLSNGDQVTRLAGLVVRKRMSLDFMTAGRILTSGDHPRRALHHAESGACSFARLSSARTGAREGWRASGTTRQHHRVGSSWQDFAVHGQSPQ